MEWFSGYTVAFAILIVGILFVITLSIYLKTHSRENRDKMKAKPIVIATLLVIALFLVFAIQADHENNPYYKIASGGNEIAEVTPTDIPTPSPTSVSTPTPSPTNTPTSEPAATPSSSPTPNSTPTPSLSLDDTTDGWVHITEYDTVQFELPDSLVRIEGDTMIGYKNINLTLIIRRKNMDYTDGWWDLYKKMLSYNGKIEINEYETHHNNTTIHHVERLPNPSSTLHYITSVLLYDDNFYSLSIVCNKKNYEQEKEAIDRFVSSIKVIDSKK